jgi:flagellar assembly factor FliW
MTIDIEKAKEFIKNVTDAKIMDLDKGRNTVEITNTNSKDLKKIKDAGLRSEKIKTNSMSFKIVNEEEFRKSYNRWIEEEKKL